MVGNSTSHYRQISYAVLQNIYEFNDAEKYIDCPITLYPKNTKLCEIINLDRSMPCVSTFNNVLSSPEPSTNLLSYSISK